MPRKRQRTDKRRTAHTTWLLASVEMIEQIVAGQTPNVKCPRCGEGDLNIRWIGDPVSRRADVYAWCTACNYGIGRISGSVPEGVPEEYFYDGSNPIPSFTEVVP